MSSGPCTTWPALKTVAELWCHPDPSSTPYVCLFFMCTKPNSINFDLTKNPSWEGVHCHLGKFQPKVSVGGIFLATFKNSAKAKRAWTQKMDLATGNYILLFLSLFVVSDQQLDIMSVRKGERRSACVRLCVCVRDRAGRVWVPKINLWSRVLSLNWPANFFSVLHLQVKPFNNIII